MHNTISYIKTKFYYILILLPLQQRINMRTVVSTLSMLLCITSLSLPRRKCGALMHFSSSLSRKHLPFSKSYIAMQFPVFSQRSKNSCSFPLYCSPKLDLSSSASASPSTGLSRIIHCRKQFQCKL